MGAGACTTIESAPRATSLPNVHETFGAVCSLSKDSLPSAIRSLAVVPPSRGKHGDVGVAGLLRVAELGTTACHCDAPLPPDMRLLLPTSLTRVRTPPQAEAQVRSELGAGCAEWIEAADLQFGTRIGGGTWSMVYAGKWQGRRVAIKAFCGIDSPQEQEMLLAMFLKEVRTLQQFRSPRLVHFFGALLDRSARMCLVTELVEGGTLHDFLHRRLQFHQQPLRPAHRFILALHITEGVAYLHTREPPIVHRDLKSKNVLVAADPANAGPPLAAKIIDYGLAECLLSAHATHRTLRAETAVQGSAGYMAPECFVLPVRLSPKTDVWALGCVLVEVFGGAPPHAECECLPEVITKVTVQRTPPDVPPHIDAAGGGDVSDTLLRCLLTDCFGFEVAARPNVNEVLERLRALATHRGFDPMPP